MESEEEENECCLSADHMPGAMVAMHMDYLYSSQHSVGIGSPSYRWEGGLHSRAGICAPGCPCTALAPGRILPPGRVFQRADRNQRPLVGGRDQRSGQSGSEAMPLRGA